MPTAVVFQFSQMQAIFRVTKSEASISRRLTRKAFFVNAATTANSFPNSQAEQMPRVLEIAIQTALAKRGVAVVVLPGDVALRDAINSNPRLQFPEIHALAIDPWENDPNNRRRLEHNLLTRIARSLPCPETADSRCSWVTCCRSGSSICR